MRWRHRDKGVSEVLQEAEEILFRDGPAAALRYLGDSEYSSTEAVVRRMHALVWENHRRLRQELLDEPFLDGVWSQCDVCAGTWLVSPLVSFDPRGQLGGRCPACGRVICAGCVGLTEGRCVCLAPEVVPLRCPSGRTPRAGYGTAEALAAGLEPYPGYTQPWDLYYRYFAWPIAVDPRFPRHATASPAAHLRWAEYLTNRGIYLQAAEQLDLVAKPSAPADRARAYWIRARLELVRLRNLTHRPFWVRQSVDPEAYAEFGAGRALQLLDDAVAADPDAADIWLTAANAHLDPVHGSDPVRAVECARRARDLLGQAPEALLALGRALIAAGRAEEAFTVLHELPSGAGGTATGGNIPGLDPGDHELAELMGRCAREPADPDALARLGRWYLRAGDTGSAATIFEWLVEQCPAHPAGYAGLGRLALFEVGVDVPARLARAHTLCLEALDRDGTSGFAHELLGLIRSWGASELAQADISPGDPVDCFRKAAAEDGTCDLALGYLAQDALDRGWLAEATELLEKAADLGTTDSMTYELLAVIYLVTGRFEDSQLAEEKARWLAPDVELVPEYRERILALSGFGD